MRFRRNIKFHMFHGRIIPLSNIKRHEFKEQTYGSKMSREFRGAELINAVFILKGIGFCCFFIKDLP